MNNPQQNNYIQYVNQNDIVKTKSVVFLDNGVTTSFVVSGINEPFFIIAVFQNNIKIEGVGFDDIENNDMLGFINSNLVDISTIPNNAFLNSEQVATMSYNNEYYKNAKGLQIPPVFDFNLILAKLEEIRICTCQPCAVPPVESGIFSTQFNNVFN